MFKLSLMPICRYLAGPVYKLIYPAKLINGHQLKEYSKKTAIIVANHHSYHDPLQLVVASPTNLHFLAKKELFQGGWGWFFKNLSLIPVNRDGSDNSLAKALQTLQNGKTIVIFPEGTTKGKQYNQLLEFRYGAVRLAKASGQPIIPVSITGKPRLFQKTVTIRVGQPFICKNESVDLLNKKLINQICQLMESSGVKTELITRPTTKKTDS